MVATNILDEAAHDALDHTGLTGVGGGTVLQVVTALLTTDKATTSDSLQDSTLTVTITPTASDSILLVEVDGTVLIQRVAGSSTERFGWVAINNDTDEVLMAQQPRGRNLIGNSAVSAISFEPIALRATYTVDSTDARTFQLQYSSGLATNVSVTLKGTYAPGVLMTVTELAA